MAPEQPAGSLPFLDAFYSLSDENPLARARAGHSIVRHCFHAPDGVNAKDATYALGRLLDGLCSGRACARQGFAGCLASFLAASPEGSFGGKEGGRSDSERVHRELTRRTAIDAEGRGKRSEMKDYTLGRLFGVLAVCKSGKLSCASVEVAKLYVRDVIDIYNWKKWIRESSVSALFEILSSISEEDRDTVVRDVIVPGFLNVQANEKFRITPDNFTPEQIAVVLYVELRSKKRAKAVFGESIVSTSNFPSLGKILASTSSSSPAVEHRHVVWNILKSFHATAPKPMREQIAELVFRHVVTDNLFSAARAKRPDRAQWLLALSLVADYAPSAPRGLLRSTVLPPATIRAAFARGVGGKGAPTPDAARALDALTTAKNDPGWKLELTRAFLDADVRFDSRTKTRAVSVLMKQLARESAEELVGFLEEEILRLSFRRDASADEEEESEEEQAARHQAKGYVDLLYGVPKLMKDGTDASAKMQNRIIGFFMAAAFLNCAAGDPVPDMDESGKGHASFSTSVATAALKIKRWSEKESAFFVPADIRTCLSCRFYSLLTDWIHGVFSAHRTPKDGDEKEKTTPGPKVTKNELVVALLSSVVEGWNRLESFTPMVELDGDNEAEEAGGAKRAATDAQTLLRLSEPRKKSKLDDASRAARAKCVSGCAGLALSLHLQFLCLEETDGRDDEVRDLIDDLLGVAESVVSRFDGDDAKSTEERGNPLAGLADVCVRALAIGTSSGDVGGGASARIIKDTVKMAWIGGLSAATVLSTSKKMQSTLHVDRDVLGIVLNSICEKDAIEEEDYESEGSSDDDASDDSEDDDSDGNDSDDDDSDDDKQEMPSPAKSESREKNSPQEDSDDDQVELDFTQLQTLLLEDGDGDENSSTGSDLEHHAGADSALANLIKMKEDTRKKARMDRERVDVNHRLSCIILLEHVFSVRNSGEELAAERDAVLAAIIPLLQCMRKLEKITSAPSGVPPGKKALLQRLSSVFKNKICKIKPNQLRHAKRPPQSTNNDPICPISEIFKEASSSMNDVHRSSCFSALLLFLKLSDLSDAEVRSPIASAYQGAVDEWCAKKSTGLRSLLFDDLFRRHPGFARIALVVPLTKVATSARSSYLKAEAFRLLAALYDDVPDSDQESVIVLRRAVQEVAGAVSLALTDKELAKANRARCVLKATENVVSFAAKHSVEAVAWRALEEVSPLAKTLAEGTKSDGIKRTCAKLSDEIELGVRGALSETKQGRNKTPKKEHVVEADLDQNKKRAKKGEKRKDKRKSKMEKETPKDKNVVELDVDQEEKSTKKGEKRKAKRAGKETSEDESAVEADANREETSAKKGEEIKAKKTGKETPKKENTLEADADREETSAKKGEKRKARRKSKKSKKHK